MGVALPTQLNATEQDTLVKQIGLSLLRAAPRDWRRVTAVYRAVGRYHELTGEVVTADGTAQEWVATHDIATLFGKLRAGMYREGRGTWFNARYQLDHPSSYNLEYDRDEPSWDLAPPSQAYADELRMFPRSEENVPDWLMRRMAGLGPERSGPRFRMARIFDGAGPNGPVITRPELDPDERDRVLAYLDGAPTVGPARGYDVDRLDPDQSAEVPIAFHSDGSWIWPAAVPYYLRTHGVAPEADLLQHIRAAGFTVPEVPDETRQAAAAHVAHGQGPQQGPPQVPGAETAQPTTQTPPVAPEQPQPQEQPGRAADVPAEPVSGSDSSGAAAAGAAGIAGAAGAAGAMGAGAMGAMAARNGTEIGDEPVQPDPADPDAPELPVRRPGKAAQELDEQFNGINGTDHASRMSPVSPFTPADRDETPAAPGSGEDIAAGGFAAQASGRMPGGDTDTAFEPAGFDTAPADTAPSDTAPSDTAPSDTAPADTASSDTAPADTASSDTAPSDTAPSQPGADDFVDPEAETAAYTLPGRGGDSGPSDHDETWSDDAPTTALGGGYDIDGYGASAPDRDFGDEPFGDASPGEPLHEQGTAFTPIPTFGDGPRSGHAADDDPAVDSDAAAPNGSDPDFDSGPPTTITSPVQGDGPPPADANQDMATPPMDRPTGGPGQTGPHQARHPDQEPPTELDEERTAPTPRQDFDQPAPPTASGVAGAVGTAGALSAAGAVASGFAGRDDAGEYDDRAAPRDRGGYEDRGGYDPQGYDDRNYAEPPYEDRRDFDDPRGYGDRTEYGDQRDVDDRGGRGSAVEPDPGPPTQIGNMPPQDPELDDLQDKLDELEVPDEYYALGMPSDYGWSLERVSDGWRVGWYDGELKSTAVFGDAADAKAFMLGKVLLSPDGVDEVPGQPDHGDPEFEQAAPEPSDAGASRPLLATLTPEIATGTRQVPEEPVAQTRTVSPADDPAGRGGPVPQAAPAPPREPVAQQAAATQHRPAAAEPQQAARPQAGQGGQAGQPSGGQQWPIQPLPGEPPLTLFRGKEMRTLPVGSELDRFGGANGNLTYAAGTPFEERSLVPEWVNRPYHVYRVQRPLETLAGVAIPWFNQPGGGAAYMLPASIEELLADGDIIELEPGEPPVD
ncbi:Protein of unknown function (DUF4237) [Prauserella salsuginis]|nr:Protein of unknown function (DUF4237) [Prauserella salsuginis]